MNNYNVLNNLKDIFSPNNGLSTVYIDGSWGIGKTHLVEKQFDDNNSYNIKYVSVFGRQSVQEIEKAMLIQLLSENGTFNKVLQVGGQIASKLLKNKTGINISDYLNLVSLDNIPDSYLNGKKYILCFDDIERKSDGIEMKQLLGLIERASKKFSIIIIFNKLKIAKDDKTIFQEYKDKLLDYEFKIKNVDDTIYISILKDRFPDIDPNYMERIINIYKENQYFGKPPSNNKKYYEIEYMSNLRIYIKFVALLHRVNIIIPNELDDIFIRSCKEVIYDYYSSDSSQSSERDFDRETIVSEVQKIFKHQKYNSEILRTFISKDNQIRSDINLLWNLHSLSQDNFEVLIERINAEIKKQNTNYFASQRQIISLVNVLIDHNIRKLIKTDQLLSLAESLYKPTFEKPEVYATKEWNDCDYFGESACHKDVVEFISLINKSNYDLFNQFILNKYDDAIVQNDILTMEKVIQYKQIDKRDDFINLFDFAFGEWIRKNNNNTDFLNKLITHANTEIVNTYLQKMMSSEIPITHIKKYEYLYNNFSIYEDQMALAQIQQERAQAEYETTL